MRLDWLHGRTALTGLRVSGEIRLGLAKKSVHTNSAINTTQRIIKH